MEKISVHTNLQRKYTEHWWKKDRNVSANCRWEPTQNANWPKSLRKLKTVQCPQNFLTKYLEFKTCYQRAGERKDRWMEQYGNSVLDNTLHDRLGRGGGPARLQKSQSAVWTRTGSGRKRLYHPVNVNIEVTVGTGKSDSRVYDCL